MTKGRLTNLIMVLVVLSAFSGLAIADTIKIGIEMPLTGYGAIYGEDAKRGVQVAVDEINKAGGIRGKKVEVLFEDDGGVGKMAVSATRKLITMDKVQVIIGGMMSSAALPAAPVARENKVVFVATISSHPELTSPGGFIYRVHTTDRVNADSAGIYATRELRLKRAAGLFASSDYGRSLERFTRESFLREGGSWLLTENFPQGSEDFRSQLTKIKNKNPEIIFIAATVKETAQMLRQMVEFRMEIPVLGSSMLEDPKLVSLAGKAANRVYYHRAAPAAGAEGKKIEAAFKTKFAAKFPGKKPAIAAKYYYDAMGLVRQAITLGGESGPAIDQGMRKIKGYPGLTGNITFNEIGDRIFKVEIVKIVDGKPVPTGFVHSN